MEWEKLFNTYGFPLCLLLILVLSGYKTATWFAPFIAEAFRDHKTMISAFKESGEKTANAVQAMSTAMVDRISQTTLDDEKRSAAIRAMVVEEVGKTRHAINNRLHVVGSETTLMFLRFAKDRPTQADIEDAESKLRDALKKLEQTENV